MQIFSGVIFHPAILFNAVRNVISCIQRFVLHLIRKLDTERKEMNGRRNMKKFIIIFLAVITGCAKTPQFAEFPKADVHVHLETTDDAFVRIVEENNFKLLTLVTQAAPQPVIEKEYLLAKNLHDLHPGTIGFATTFTMDGFGTEGWLQHTLDWLQKSFDDGAAGVKVWKDIGMVFRDRDSSFIMIDDPRFDPVFDFIESQNKTLVNHNGEPRNCWLPLNRMTVRGDSSYYAEHPQYHMYLHPGYPSYEALNAARNRMLEKHPHLRYVGCHLGSLEWNVDSLAATLDRYPNMCVDMAARISHFKVQDRDKVRRFIIEYQDRLLYGTDISIRDRAGKSSTEQAEEILKQVWLNDWEYFTTDHLMTQDDKVKNYRGLKLPLKVLRKIYYENAMRMYPDLNTKSNK